MRFLRFQHTAARRRLPISDLIKIGLAEFQHTAARRRLHPRLINYPHQSLVSTHSRPKAAASAMRISPKLTERFQHTAARRRLRIQLWMFRLKICFNTQPPEGGCVNLGLFMLKDFSFNTQPPEGGCLRLANYLVLRITFQHTAARRRLRKVHFGEKTLSDVSTHSRPKAAAYRNGFD